MKSYFSNIDSYTFTGSAFLIGIILSSEFNDLEKDSVGNWLQLVGLTMQTLGSQNIVIDAANNKESADSSDDIDTLKDAIKRIDEELDKIKKNCKTTKD